MSPVAVMKAPRRAATGGSRTQVVSTAAFRQILHTALAGDNACAACGGVVPVSSRAVELVESLHNAGRLEAIEAEGVRMMLLMGSLEAGCGMAAADADGRMRVSCPPCASPVERSRARELTTTGAPYVGARKAGRRRRLRLPLARAW
jgi:hypothetical protein